MKLYKVLLSVFIGLLLVSVSSWADLIISTSVTYTGQVVRVTADTIVIKQGENEFTVPKATIRKMEVNKPVEFDAASELLKSGKNAQAVAAFKALVDRFAGLQADWALESMVSYGEALTATKDYVGAKRVLDDAIRLYPGEQARRLEVEVARLLMAQGNQAKAVEILRAYLDVTTKRAFLTDQDEYSIADAYVLLGDCLQSSDALEDALDHYLKVVTLFDLNDNRATEAQFKAGKIFEQLKNWKRAKDLYGEAAKGDAKSPFPAQAKSRLDALNKEHP